jgi:transcription elongation factor SPT5
MGVIVRLEKETFRVLNMFNKVVTVNSQAISKKRANKFAAALDSENKTINVNDIVKVIEGVNRGQQGQVKYLYRHFAFIYSKTFPENGGYFVCNTKQLLLASNHKTMTSTSAIGGGGVGGGSGPGGQLGFMSPRVLASPMHPSSNGANGSTGGETGSRSTRQGKSFDSLENFSKNLSAKCFKMKDSVDGRILKF